MKIIFTRDYQGRETAGQLKTKGTVESVGIAFALELIALDVAEEASEITELPQVEPIRKRKVNRGTDT